jgi:hypothetical protein
MDLARGVYCIKRVAREEKRRKKDEERMMRKTERRECECVRQRAEQGEGRGVD